MQLRRLLATSAVVLAAATTLAACGKDGATSQGTDEGVYVTTGHLAYQVQISRQLNPFSFEDRDFLKSVPAGERSLPHGVEFFGVFLRVFNRSDAPHQSASNFIIEDTTGKQFRPVPVPLAESVGFYQPLVVKPGDSIPVPGSFARENATQGGLVLFKIPVTSYANRPLELRIASPEGGPEATVNLDV
jgi:hypothetical protein